MSNNFKRLWDEARVAAQRAAQVENMRLGPHRGLDCGFAWIEMPGNTAFARWAKSQGLTSRGYPRGLTIWYSQLHSLPTQSVSVHEAAAKAACEVLQRGLGTSEIHHASRLD